MPARGKPPDRAESDHCAVCHRFLVTNRSRRRGRCGAHWGVQEALFPLPDPPLVPVPRRGGERR